MSYLIDGHNLIPKIRGMNLRQINDEEILIEKLQTFCRTRQKNVIVYFDGAPAGYQGRQKYGRLTAVFVRQGQTADDAIKTRLRQLGKAAKNWQVVSSDRQIIAEARTLGAKVISSATFAGHLEESAYSSSNQSPIKEEKLSADEVDEWMQLFSHKGDENDLFTQN
ncbi:MAG: NYN domain-containing protein [Anaerolineaceae bacterium]|nr:NYN domain-containing protein [Anaerolineaceae bacterium]